ncbi:MAG: TRAP transporter small permease [Synergistaceae bacterium]|nr:TRAP transporter small permease [Synergistaceae bacterium]
MGRVWRAFNIFEESVMVAGMGVMVLFNFLNVVCRYLLPQTPFSYTEELIVLIFVWVSMFGISYGYRRGTHTVLTVLSDLLPGRIQPAIIVFSAAASGFLMALMAWTGYGMVQNQMKFGQILPGMRIPMAVVGWALPIGAAVAFVSVIKSAFDEIGDIPGAGGKDS